MLSCLPMWLRAEEAGGTSTWTSTCPVVEQVLGSWTHLPVTGPCAAWQAEGGLERTELP